MHINREGLWMELDAYKMAALPHTPRSTDCTSDEKGSREWHSNWEPRSQNVLSASSLSWPPFLLPHCWLRLQAKTMHTHFPVWFYLFRCAASLRTVAYQTLPHLVKMVRNRTMPTAAIAAARTTGCTLGRAKWTKRVLASLILFHPW